MSTMISNYADMSSFHDPTQSTPNNLQSDPFAPGPSNHHHLQYHSLPTIHQQHQQQHQSPQQHQAMPPPPHQMTHSNSAPEIPYYEPPSVFAPPNPPLQAGGYPQLQVNQHPYTDVSMDGQNLPMASYVPDYHFGGPPTASPAVFGALPPPAFPNGPLGPPEGDWDDDETREVDMVYGNLEVSPGSSSLSSFSSASVPSPRPAKKRSISNSVWSSPSFLADSLTVQGLAVIGKEGTGLRPAVLQCLPGGEASVVAPLPASSCQSLFLEDWFRHTTPSAAHQQVKHRRRTTPDQLRVLEYWFSQNPKPDNALREWLASELGMTKRVYLFIPSYPA